MSCTTILSKGKRAGEACGKKCIKDQVFCRSHAPRGPKEVVEEETHEDPGQQLAHKLDMPQDSDQYEEPIEEPSDYASILRAVISSLDKISLESSGTRKAKMVKELSAKVRNFI